MTNFNASSGLIVNSVTFSVLLGALNSVPYLDNTDTLNTDVGNASAVASSNNDFVVSLAGFLRPGRTASGMDTLRSASGRSRRTVSHLVVTESSAAPLPASALLLFGCPGGLAAMRPRIDAVRWKGRPATCMEARSVFYLGRIAPYPAGAALHLRSGLRRRALWRYLSNQSGPT